MNDSGDSIREGTDEYLPVPDDSGLGDTSGFDGETRDVSTQVEASGLHVEATMEEFLEQLGRMSAAFARTEGEAKSRNARLLLGAELGRGSIGVVWEARDLYLHRDLAVKALRSDGGEVRKGRLARFLSEAQITAQLSHPAVIPVYELGLMEDGMPFFAMKRVRGLDMGKLMDQIRESQMMPFRGAFNRNYLMRLFSRVCQGMAYAHARGVIHRDLKPDNLMIGEFGEVYIMDWGLAKILGQPAITDSELEPVHSLRSALEIQTADGVVAGTPAYMSPEQARGEADRLGFQSDVFSLGLIMVELLTLVRAIPTGTSEEVIERVKNADGVSPIVLSPDSGIDPAIDSICLRCTAARPEDRYPSAWDLWQDVRAYQEGRAMARSGSSRVRDTVVLERV